MYLHPRHALVLAVALSIAATLAPAQTPSLQPVPDTALRAQLLQRRAADQSMRDTLMLIMQAGRMPDGAFMDRLDAVDRANTAWIRGILETRGWPGGSLVGPDAAAAAFLLVQHATHDTAFMARALPMLEKAVGAAEASPGDYALLYDRVAVQAGRPQRYGTQASLFNGRLVFAPIEDSSRVDARRAAMRLPPLAVYARVLDSLYRGGGRR